MAQKILKWGLLSTARINRALIPPLRTSKRSQLYGVASRSLEKAESYAREWNIPHAYQSYEAMLADPEIDVIYNPLPNSLHAAWTVKACQAGKHVLCEKPLALSTDEADAVIQAAGQAGVVVSEAFMYRHHPQTTKVTELVQSGALGEVRLLRGTFSFNLTRTDDVRLDPDLGGGSIWDIGCYPISYIRTVLAAEPEEVFGWQITGDSGVDEVFAGQMRFASGALAQFDSSFRVPFRAEIEIVGSKHSLEVPEPFKPGERETLYLRTGDKVEKVPVRGQDLYLGEVEDMAAAVLDGKPPAISLADSRFNTAAITALLRSAAEGHPIRVER